MKLALFQLPSPSGDVEAAFDAVERAMAVAAAAGAGHAVFPEVFLPGYNVEKMTGQHLGGEWETRLSDIARRAECGLTIGLAEAEGGHLYNSAITLGAGGERLAHFRKIQLYGPREKAIFTPGDHYAIFDLEGIRTAILICYDVEFAPHVRALAERGVGLILCPTANPVPYGYVGSQLVPMQALNHGLAIAFANYCGPERDLTYSGSSSIVASDGAVLAQAGPGEAVLIVDLAHRPDPAMIQTQLTDYRKVT